MGVSSLRELAGEWELAVGLPGAEDGGYVRHYFDLRGVARLYAMTFGGRTWTRDFRLTYARVQ